MVASAVIAARSARIRVTPSLDSSLCGSLPRGTEVVVGTDRRFVRRGAGVVARSRLIKPIVGWVSTSTLEFKEPKQLAWKGTQASLRQHQRTLAAIRRKRFEMRECIERHRDELKQLEGEEARISRLIMECLEHQARLSEPERPVPKTRDDLFLATRASRDDDDDDDEDRRFLATRTSRDDDLNDRSRSRRRSSFDKHIFYNPSDFETPSRSRRAPRRRSSCDKHIYDVDDDDDDDDFLAQHFSRPRRTSL